MGRHSWVAAAEDGVRFGVLLTGARGLTDPSGGEHGWLMHDDPLAEIFAATRLAEEGGFDGVFVPDTPRLFPDPLVTLSALAGATSRVTIGSLVIVAAFRHPALLAKMTSDIDRLSGGRLVLGLGVGESERQYATVGATWGSPKERQVRLDEAIDLMRALWTEMTIDFAGQFHRAADMRVGPGPVQAGGPPIIIAGSGEGTLRQAATRGDACNFFGGAARVGEQIGALDRICNEVGRPRDEVLRTYYDFPILASTRERAGEKLRACMSEDVIARRSARELLIVGTPDDAIAHYRRLIGSGIQYVTINLADTADHETLELMATTVIPAVKL